MCAYRMELKGFVSNHVQLGSIWSYIVDIVGIEYMHIMVNKTNMQQMHA